MTDKRQLIELILSEAVPTRPGDLLHRFMERLGFDFELPPTIGMHPDLPYWLGEECFGSYPCAVMPLQNSAGELVALQTVYLGPDGFAPVVVPVQTHFAADMRGAFFQVDRQSSPALAVGVGIGVPLAARTLVPLTVPLCAVDTSDDLAAFDWPSGTSDITVLCDHNNEDQAATLASRAISAGLSARVLRPATRGATWVDEFVFRGAVPADEIAAAKSSAC